MSVFVTSPVSRLVLVLASLLYREALSEWVETAKLQDGAANDIFGYSVAIDNGTLVGGAMFDDSDLASNCTGSVSIFELVDGEWHMEQKVTASDAESDDRFGYAVATSNGFVAV